jgi:hypothetical protein
MSPITEKRIQNVSFSGHETFPFRHSWLKKGVAAVSEDSTFFSKDRAMVDLGVGKNMVQSIRHWCTAARLIEEEGNSGGGRVRLAPSELGRMLFAETGADQYLEDPATLWLLHWLISSNTRASTTWHWMFNYWGGGLEFTKEAVAQELQRWLEKHGFKPASANTLKRDIDCFVRTYVNSRQSRAAVLEDTLDCPLVDLRLITELPDGRTFLFQRGPHPSLPDELFLFALFEFWRSESSRASSSARSIALEKIAYEPGSPGRIFKLDEESLAERLERAGAVSRGTITYGENSGLKQVYMHSPDIDPADFLLAYYRKRSGEESPQGKKQRKKSGRNSH